MNKVWKTLLSSMLTATLTLTVSASVMAETVTGNLTETQQVEEVAAPKAKLLGKGSFDIITEPFEWWQDVTKVIIHTSKTVQADEVSKEDFTVTAINYDGLTNEEAYNGPRTITDAYVSDVQGNRSDSGEYIVLELTHGVTQTSDPTDNNRYTVEGAATGRYSTGGLYYPFDMNYTVTDQEGNTYRQNEIKNVLIDEFLLEDFTGQDGRCVNYALYEPEEDGKEHPLMIWFHGMGEGGITNNGVQLYANRASAFADEEFQKIMDGAYFLAPQAPDLWPYFPGGGFNSRSLYTNTVFELIDQVIAENPEIDTDRVYIGGLSMGGYMAWNMLREDNEDRFTAAIMSAAAFCPDEALVTKLKDFPMWIVYNTADGLCTPEGYTRKSYEMLLAAGSTVARATEYTPVTEGAVQGDCVFDGIRYSGHDGGWIPVYRNEPSYVDNSGKTVTIFEWLAAQTKNKNTTTPPWNGNISYPSSSVPTSGSWQQNAVGWWYSNADGSYAQNEWKQIDGKWYHFDANGYMQTGWIQIPSGWYYLEPDGSMATGWKFVDGRWYYLNPNGDMADGWKYIDGSWYYLNTVFDGARGAMMTGWQWINGSYYYMTASGNMLANTITPDGYRVGVSGAWIA